jgi:MscS family membrane protein
MKEILQYKILDNAVEAYLYVIGTIVLVMLLKRLISRFLASKLLGIITNQRKSPKREAFLSLVIKPIEKFLLVLIAYTALDKLYFPSFFKIRFFHEHITSEYIVNIIAVTIIVTVFIQLCIRVLKFIAQILEEKANLSNDKTENQLIIFFNDFFKVILIIIGALLVIKFGFEKDISTALAGLSIVGAAVALAMRESLENLIASFIIFFDKPFAMGDVVKVQSFTGTIEKIGLRSTRIRTENKTFITVPNKQMVDTIIDNISLRTQRKVELRLELSLSSSSAQLKETSDAIKNILKQEKEVELFYVYLMDTGKNAHVLAVDYFTSFPQPIELFNELREAINIAVIALLESKKIELAAANTTVVINQSSKE